MQKKRKHVNLYFGYSNGGNNPIIDKTGLERCGGGSIESALYSLDTSPAI